MMTSLEPWQEWNARCAISRCSPATATVLQRFAARRFHYYLMRCLGQQFSVAAVPDDRTCFHLLETHCCVSSHRSGKRYKEWISNRGDGKVTAALFESGASLLLRDVVRTFAKRECPAPQQVSFDAVIAGTDGLTLADLLPAPRQAESGDGERSEAVARACLVTLSDNHRLVVLAKRAGQRLSQPLLLTLLGVGKSRASELWTEVYARVAAETRSQMPAGDRESWLDIALQASERLGELIFLCEQVEKRWAAYFKGVEDVYERLH